MRLAALAAIGAALAIPGLAGAGDPQFVFELRPPVPIVLESGGRRDALLALQVRNPNDHTLRVDRVRLTYFEGDTPVKTVDPATEIFTDAGLLSDPRVEGNAVDTWDGLCLAPPTAATSRVRFDFNLVQRRGLRAVRSSQSLDIPLRAPVATPALAMPVTGAWRVTQGHTCETNHRRGRLGGEFAWDLAAVNESGRTNGVAVDAPRRNGESPSYGRPVRAPIAGRVVTAVDHVADNDEQREFPRRSLVDSVRVPRWVFGNYVVIEDGAGVFVLLAHLQKGSVAVRPDDVVREGDLLAYCGNSGNSMLPHLHIQVMDRADPADPSVSGVPAVFRNFVEATVRGDGAQRETLVRRVAEGDPPQGSVVFVDPPTATAPTSQ